MEHLLFFSFLIAIISNVLFSSMVRINNKSYHIFEIMMVISLFFTGLILVKLGQNSGQNNDYKYVWQDYGRWFMIYCLLRFGLYSVIYNKITKQPLSHLGTWGLDRFLNWLINEKLNQGPDAILWFYFMSNFISIAMYIVIVWF